MYTFSDNNYLLWNLAQSLLMHRIIITIIISSANVNFKKSMYSGTSDSEPPQ